jgi:hypothetical protein
MLTWKIYVKAVLRESLQRLSKKKTLCHCVATPVYYVYVLVNKRRCKFSFINIVFGDLCVTGSRSCTPPPPPPPPFRVCGIH